MEWTPSPEYRKKVLPYGKEILALCQEYVFQTKMCIRDRVIVFECAYIIFNRERVKREKK